MVLLPMKLPIPLPVPIDPHCPQVTHRLGAGFGSAHSRLFHAVLHQVPTGSFHHPRPDRQAARQVVVVVHVWPVALVVAHRPPDRLPLRPRTRRCCTSASNAVMTASVARYQRLQVRADPRQALRMGLPQQGIGCVPPILGGMNDVQDEGVRRKRVTNCCCSASAPSVSATRGSIWGPSRCAARCASRAWRPLSPPGWPAVLC